VFEREKYREYREVGLFGFISLIPLKARERNSLKYSFYFA
jgi:hypothetical protein